MSVFFQHRTKSGGKVSDELIVPNQAANCASSNEPDCEQEREKDDALVYPASRLIQKIIPTPR